MFGEKSFYLLLTFDCVERLPLIPLTASKVLALDKTKNTLSSCFDSRTFEIKISRFYNQTNKNIGYFWFCPRLIVPLQKDYEN